jgi:outer membrane protein assembly factor BamB
MLLLVLLLTATFAPIAEGDSPTWPQWRGPTRDGHVGGADWPATLQGQALQLLWRVELGPSYSGPVVAPDRVFVTETIDKKFEVVRALDRTTGKELWKARWEGSTTVPAYARGNGEWVRSTPAYDGEAVYVLGMRDVLVCLEAGSGKERWRVDFVKRYGTRVPIFGGASSPLVDGDAVYALGAASLVKLDRRTGKSLWRALEDKDVADTYASATSSPVLATLAGKRQVLVQNRKVLAGVDPESGRVLWRTEVPAFRATNVLTPTVCGPNSVFTSAFGGRSFRYDIVPDGDGLKARAAWDVPAQGYMSTPVVIGDNVYLFLRNQRFTCLDLRTGKERWTTAKSFGRYWSLVAQKDRILALDQVGKLYLIKASPAKFDLLDERKVSDAETWAHLAVCGDEVFVRELNALAVYRWRAPAP